MDIHPTIEQVQNGNFMSRLARNGSPLRNRTALVVVAVTLIAIPAVLVGLIGTSHAQSVVTPQIAGSVAAPTTAEVSPVCDAPNTSSTLGPASSVPSSPTSTVVTPTGGVDNFTATSTGIYVDTGTALVTYSLAGAQVGSFALPSGFTGGNEISQPVVDSSGNIYLATYYGQKVDKFSPSGTVLWSTDPESGNPTGLFSMGSGSGFQLVVSVVQSSSRSDLLNPATGAISGSFPLVDRGFVTQESNGNLLYSGNGYVTTYSSSGTKLSTFGAAQTEGNGAHTGSGYQFYYASQAVQGPDGTIYTADPLHTIEATSPTGYLQDTTTLGGALNMGGFNFYLVGSTLYYQGGAPFNGGADNISSVSLATLTTYLGAVHVPTDTLGWGAGLSSTASANYFAPGSTPTVVATFDPWWASQASHLQLSYSVEDTTSLTAETVPTPTTLALPTTTSGLASIPLTLTTADQQPGPYLVQATLTDTSTSPPTSLGTTCIPYTVGAGGDALNLASLPTGIGGGGPTDTRGVALNGQLGLSGLRGAQINWSSLLPNCSPSAPTLATCGPSAMNIASLPNSYFQAAAAALADHVSYWVQASSGSFGSVPSAVVQGGWWQADVTRLIQHYATVPSGCGVCAPVTMWEPWNEPNNTGWSNGATYVTQILQPFDAAVKSVLPGSSSTVIGGASLDVPIGWWQQLIGAGGLSDLDVASVHPYTGNNDSFEEYGNIPVLQQLEGMLGSIPLWFTEVGWWSDGDYNYLNQANVVARAMIWQKVLHVPVWNYFFSEGNWGNDGVSFSLIQAGSTDDYVKPAALATMATSDQVGARPYVSMPSTGIPQTYEATFGPDGSDNNQLAAVWSDGLATTGAVTVTAPGGGTVPVTVTSEYGSTTDASVTSGAVYSLPIADQITYLSYPVGDTLSIAPPQSYGTDLAAATSTNHSSATASSGNASAAIAGTTSGSGWSSTNGDSTPSFTVNLANPATINRVVIDTQSVGSTASSVRNYVVSVDEPSSGWTTVATVAGQYRTHELQLAFDPVMASAVKITVSEVNFGGYYGGGIPPFWTHGYGIATAFLHAIQVYGGTGTASQVNGSSLTPLIAGGPGTPPTTTTTTTTTTTAPPTTTPPTAPTAPTAPTTSSGGGSPTRNLHPVSGYWLTTGGGSVFSFGQASFFGSTGHLNRPIVGMAPTPDGQGYWLVASDGGIFTFGDAGFYGSAGAINLNKPIVGMASTPDGKGYWMVASDGGIFSYGDASFYGSTGNIALNKPIVHMAATPDGRGYWLVASDGGVFTFGDASFYGSTGNIALNKPIVGMTSTPDGKGYWMVASDGGIFTFGDAKFDGSTGSIALNRPIVGMTSTPDGKGYWLVASDGGIFTFGDASFYGSAGGVALDQPAVAIS
jgi:hypothetical protein